MIDDLATLTDQATAHAALRQRGVHQTPDGRWVVGRATDVREALSCPGLHIPPPPGGGPLDRLRRAMARFSDGPEHERRRRAIEATIARLPAAALAERVAALAAEAIATGAPIDAAALSRAVLTAAFADALGPDLTAPIDDVAELSARLAPAVGRTRSDDDDVSALVARVVGEPMAPSRVAAFSIVHQARDATAGLVAAALLRHGDVEAAARLDAPVQLTTRRAGSGVRLGGVDVPPAADVVVVLASASSDPAHADLFPLHPPTFGAGPHACPGAELARTLAGAIVAAVQAVGARVTPTGAYEARSNLRIPSVTVRSS